MRPAYLCLGAIGFIAGGILGAALALALIPIATNVLDTNPPRGRRP